MASKALHEWQTISARSLDDVREAHRIVRRSGVGRRDATRRLTHAYTLLLAARFQQFCRALHWEAFAWVLSEQRVAGAVESMLLVAVANGRALDRGNANARTIQQDFRLLRADFWAAIDGIDAHGRTRRAKLEILNEWRNAIAHHDFTKSHASTEALWLKDVESWRRACNGLATSMDAVVGDALASVVGIQPW